MQQLIPDIPQGNARHLQQPAQIFQPNSLPLGSPFQPFRYCLVEWLSDLSLNGDRSQLSLRFRSPKYEYVVLRRSTSARKRNLVFGQGQEDVDVLKYRNGTSREYLLHLAREAALFFPRMGQRIGGKTAPPMLCRVSQESLPVLRPTSWYEELVQVILRVVAVPSRLGDLA